MRLYRQLRGRLLAADIDWPYLAAKLQLSTATVTRSMTGRRDWTIAECYAILKLLNEPAEKLPELFPPGGKV